MFIITFQALISPIHQTGESPGAGREQSRRLKALYFVQAKALIDNYAHCLSTDGAIFTGHGISCYSATQN